MIRPIYRGFRVLTSIVLTAWVAFALAGRAGSSVGELFWLAADESVAIYTGQDRKELCPVHSKHRAQPFCRKFSAPLLIACGDSRMIQLVLINGEVHRVDSALVGIKGNFEAEYRPSHQLKLEKAWIPSKYCATKTSPVQVLAVDKSGQLWHFDRVKWRPFINQSTPIVTRERQHIEENNPEGHPRS